MHVGYKVKLGILHLKSDSPAERRRRRTAKQKRRAAKQKRRQAKWQRRRQWMDRRANARWNGRVREPVVASTKPRAVRDDAKAQKRAARAARASTRATAARADAARVTRPQNGYAAPKPVVDTHSGGFCIGPDPAAPGEGMFVWSGARPGQGRVISGPHEDGRAANAWVDDNMLEVVRAARTETHPAGPEHDWQRDPDEQPVIHRTGPGADAYRPRGAEYAEYAAMTPQQKTEHLQRAGLCGAKTQDGGRCTRRGDCPYHRRAMA